MRLLNCWGAGMQYIHPMFVEDSMSLCRHAHRSRVRSSGLLLLLMTGLFALTALAQDSKPPKADVFVGYQWLDPGGDVPIPGNPFNPSVQHLHGIAQGWGGAITYNFNRYWGLEGDFGGNYDKIANESTASIGPRLMFRGDNVNLFAHTLFGYNRLTPKGLGSSNGIGAVLGGGIDLKLWKPLSFRLIEADYVWAHHNFADAASQEFP